MSLYTLKIIVRVFGILIAGYVVFYGTYLRHTRAGRRNTKTGKILFKAVFWGVFIGIIIQLVNLLNESKPQEVESSTTGALFLEHKYSNKSDTLMLRFEYEAPNTNLKDIRDSLFKPISEFALRTIKSGECEANSRRLAMKYFEDHQWDSSAMIWEQVEQTCFDQEAAFYAGTSNLFAGDTTKAEAYLNNAIKLDPAYYNAYMNLGGIHFGRKEYDVALVFYKRAAAISPTTKAYANIGLTYIFINDIAHAINYFDRALEKDSINELAIYYMGKISLFKKQYETSLRYFLKLLPTNANDANLLNNIGTAYWEKNNIETAIQYFEKALKVNPNFYDARANLAQIYSAIGKKEESFRLYESLPIDSLSNIEIAPYVRMLAEYSQFDKLRNIVEDRPVSDTDWSVAIAKARIYVMDSKCDSAFNLIFSKPAGKLIDARLLMVDIIFCLEGLDSSLYYAKKQYDLYKDENEWLFIIGQIYLEKFQDTSGFEFFDSTLIYWQKLTMRVDSSIIAVRHPHVYNILESNKKRLKEISVKISQDS